MAAGANLDEPSGYLGASKAQVWVALITAFASIVVAFISYQQASNTNNQLQGTRNDLKGATEQIHQLDQNSPGTLQQGQKLCRVLQGRTWRDSVIVPQNWSKGLCEDYAVKLGGTDFQLGCIFKDGTVLADKPRTIPFPNCGWN